MNALLAWLRSKNITSHTIAAALAVIAGLIVKDEQVRDFLISSLVAHPKIAAGIVSAAGIWFKYSHSSSPAGAVAQAKQVLTSPDAPTSSQVDAATTKP